MPKISIAFFLLYIKLALNFNCIENEKGCLKCNTETYLCDKCLNDALVPDNEGGCTGNKKCNSGENYCIKCNELTNDCETCEKGYYPDRNGGCAYTENCQISYKGECYKCNENYFIIGKRSDSIKDFKLCKSIFSSDLKNCEIINEEKGNCALCEDGYFLDDEDFKCIKTQNCSVSVFGICTKCSYGFYLNRQNNSCILSEYNRQLLYCKETLDGEYCDICNDYYYLSGDKRCMRANYCLKTDEFDCKECDNGLFLAENKACSTTDNCHSSDHELALCEECVDGFYLDIDDRKCKNNKDEDDFKFCKEVDKYCTKCEKGYFMGEDNRCSTSRNCAESEDGICTFCSSFFYLTKDERCVRVENCLYSNEIYECIECEENFILDIGLRRCREINNTNFTNCKTLDPLGNLCGYCRDDYYLNFTDNLCYPNNEYGSLYKCALASESGECMECIQDYYLGEEDNKCVHTEGCLSSDEYHNCLSCDVGFCFNQKDSMCYYNYDIEEENEKIYYKCIRTNKDGTKCEICEEHFEVGENGLCVNNYDCETFEGGKCIKCKELDEEEDYLCLNQDYGCAKTFFRGCSKCNNTFDLDECSECLDGYTLNEYAKMCSLD